MKWRLTPARKDAVVRGRAKTHQRFQRFFGDTALAALGMTLGEIAENPGLSDVFQADPTALSSTPILKQWRKS